MDDNKTTEKSRLTLNISDEARQTLDWICKQRGGVSYVEAIRRALGTERILMDAQINGARILIESRSGDSKELRLV